jgi:hypothetical protein
MESIAQTANAVTNFLQNTQPGNGLSEHSDTQAPALRHDAKTAIDFLRRLDPDGRHNLWAKHPETGENEGKTFRPHQWTAIEAFIEGHPKWNIYFSANEPQADAPHKKLAAANIASVRCALIDCDPPEKLELAGKGAEARQIAEANARRAFVTAGALIDSGGGFQPIWRLKDKLPAASHQTAIEDQNRGLATRFEADRAVTDMPRVLRLPGTVN